MHCARGGEPALREHAPLHVPRARNHPLQLVRLLLVLRQPVLDVRHGVGQDVELADDVLQRVRAVHSETDRPATRDLSLCLRMRTVGRNLVIPAVCRRAIGELGLTVSMFVVSCLCGPSDRIFAPPLGNMALHAGVARAVRAKT